ncbi:hypothetical protein [Flavisolibacter tropicus]|uniref:Uncharacterized protein n=1 Tax=Flavisolibacter tropicus TaxID=1492898 RepID=A0A172TS03_9BACT|nr:hypothetical protein [Flavisolibacter tropicus]ANE49786.1 hypothetical protein SY85_04035 [Flavisolibacter tropicus]
MKLLLPLLFSLPISVFGQDCSLKKTKDQFSQEPKLTTGFVNLSNAKLSMDADAKEIHLLFLIGSNGEMKCFEEASTLTIAFDSTNTKANLRNGGSMNCEGYFDVVFKNTPTTTSYLNRLTTHTVKTLTFTGNNKTVTVVTLSDDQKALLRQLANCIATESKTLIK